MSDEPVTKPRAFVDSNIWLYAFIEGDDPTKTAMAKGVVTGPHIVTSAQVINEVARNLLRKARFTEERIQALIASFHARYTVVPLDQAMLLRASELRVRHQFAFWDSLIVTAALAGQAEILYSEDMHDGLLVDGRLHIRNPFRAQPEKSLEQ